jgi:hypothetical protein
LECWFTCPGRRDRWCKRASIGLVHCLPESLE